MPDAVARDQRLCRNFLAILRSIDEHELVLAGVLVDEDLPEKAQRFMRDPFRTYLSFGDEQQAKCFALVQTRMPAELRA